MSSKDRFVEGGGVKGGGDEGQKTWLRSVCPTSTLTCVCVQSLDRVVVSQPSPNIGQAEISQAVAWAWP